jgi:hypothetical protein
VRTHTLPSTVTLRRSPHNNANKQEQQWHEIQHTPHRLEIVSENFVGHQHTLAADAVLDWRSTRTRDLENSLAPCSDVEGAMSPNLSDRPSCRGVCQDISLVCQGKLRRSVHDQNTPEFGAPVSPLGVGA